MRERLLSVLFGVIILGALGFTAASLWELDRHDIREVLTQPPAREDLRGEARDASCGEGLPLWLELLDRQPDDLEALQAVARCARGGNIADDAATFIERSRILSTLPLLLEEMDLKEKIPILKDVDAENSENLLVRGRLQRRLGQGRDALNSFQRALSLDPTNADLRFEVAHTLVEQGRMSEARVAFRQALAGQGASLAMTHAYAVTVAYPIATAALLFGFFGLFGQWMRRENFEFVEALERSADAPGRVLDLLLVISASSVIVLYARIQMSGDRLAFGVLAMLMAAAAGWMMLGPLRKPFGQILGTAGEKMGDLIVGRVDRTISRLPVLAQISILGVSVFGLVVLAPMVEDGDFAVLIGFLSLMLLFSTIGSLGLTMLRESQSVGSELRWLAVAGTLPYLCYFLYVERATLMAPISAGRFVSVDAQNRLAGYLLVWVVGLCFAVVLSRILSRSLLEPLNQILRAIRSVQSGDFAVTVGVRRRDEIGQLADAVHEMAGGLAHREAIKRTFQQYVDKRVADRLIAGDAQMEVATRYEATVLFSDVRGFTALSERLPPEEVVEVLNDYFARMTPIVAEHGGVVDKFMGDGMMAVWGVPTPVENAERLAVQAAEAMLRALDGLNVSLAERGLPTVEIGVGINRGPMIAGPIGSPSRKEYTVIGDTVNTAQRVEGMARSGYSLLVTPAVAEVVRPYVSMEPLPPVRVKGKADDLLLFEVRSVHTRVALPQSS